MKILIIGHRSFAARGIVSLLMAHGHGVTCFSRGLAGRREDVVTGPLEKLAANPHLADGFDTVINYIVLKDESVEKNVAFIAELLRFCADRQVKHLIQISSVSSFARNVKDVSDVSPTEIDPLAKGSYGSLKVAADLYLLQHTPSGLALSLVRPGFILGSGLVNPIVGIATRLPWNRALVLGAASAQMPVISRDILNRALLRLAEDSPQEKRQVLLLVAPNSPSRREYIGDCCRYLGLARKTLILPVPAWYAIAITAEVAARLVGQSKLKPFSKLRSRLLSQRFNPLCTEKRLGMDLTFDWSQALRQSLDGQELNFTLPPRPSALQHIGAGTVTFVGYGRIVKQKHLPALQRLGFEGAVHAYDTRSFVDSESGQSVLAIDDNQPSESDLFVVASPGAAHSDSMGFLANVRGTILVEKPLCLTSIELAQWRDFAAGRESATLVCHNYRFKKNVQRMVSFLHDHNPGRIHGVHVHFQSPSVTNELVSWRRAEREARTLLMDYAIHFLDVACMFGVGSWTANVCEHEVDSHGNTALINGRISANYPVTFHLRQGFAPRRARLLMDFQNYAVSIGFFPDTFVAYMADDNPWLYQAEKCDSLRATLTKVRDWVTGRDSDTSHAVVLAGAAGVLADQVSCLSVERLSEFYEIMFKLSDLVYGPACQP